MIKEIKSKIFMIIMLSFSVMIISIIVAINIINYSQSRQESFEILDKFNSLLNRSSFIKPPINRPESNDYIDKGSNDIFIRMDDFYIVFLENNRIIKTISQSEGNYSSEEINDYTNNIIDMNKKEGIIKNLVYNVKKKGDTAIVVLMDNEIAENRLREMLIISIIISVISLLIIYFISKKIANLLIKPIEDTLKKQKQFISDASHELKTPLAIICANADALKYEIGDNKWLTYIQSEVNSMSKLVNSLLSLAKLENMENQGDYFKEFNLSKLIEGATIVFESLAFEKEIILEENIQKDITLKGDKEEIKQVITILVDNAINHTKSGGKIIVELIKRQNNIVINVKNTGNPIDREERKKIFDRFYRSDKSRNRSNSRYGLGLSIAKAIVEKHKGSIDVNCQNGFTIFTVIL